MCQLYGLLLLLLLGHAWGLLLVVPEGFDSAQRRTWASHMQSMSSVLKLPFGSQCASFGVQRSYPPKGGGG